MQNIEKILLPLVLLTQAALGSVIDHLETPVDPVVIEIPGVILQENEVVVWSFDEADFSIKGDAPAQESSGSIFTFWSGSFDHINESSQIEVSFFENPEDEVAFKNISIGFVENDVGIKVGTSFISSPNWVDFNGRIEFESTVGNAHMPSFEVYTISNGKEYVASIPEPSSTILLVVGVGILFVARKNFQPAGGAYGENAV